MRYKINTPLFSNIREMPKVEQPREKLKNFGVKQLTDEELVALLISSGNKENGIKNITNEVINILDQKGELSLNDLNKIKGLGLAKSSQLCAALELGRRKIEKRNRQIIEPEDVHKVVRHYATREQELFISVAINCAHEILAIDVASMGTINQCIVHPREVFSNAIKNRAVAIIICHNHPTGNLNPSLNDLNITRRLIECGKILGIEIIDHLIFSEDEYHSMKEFEEL
ncbi:MAG: DNA repair protein RadC [Sphaerochaetaceae bacterium]|nr:DNA repair protein RadC [Sphaerochaetaceae bacterium]MDC7248596.1 DNA repair protein RadC [Sphaerochaetaceae bacterium]